LICERVFNGRRITGEALAEALPEQRDRVRVIQCMLLMALMDGRADREEAALIHRVAVREALGIE
jgi:uncharacterized tellurite resistance protein B-like protein